MFARDECVVVSPARLMSIVLVEGADVDERDNCEERCTKGGWRGREGLIPSWVGFSGPLPMTHHARATPGLPPRNQ